MSTKSPVSAPRKILSALSLTGVTESAYLSLQHSALATSNPTVLSLCGGGNCSPVLSSPYSTVPLLNLPLSSIGLVAYASLFLLSFVPLLAKREVKQDLDLEFNTSLILGISTMMGVFSGYLMYLLLFVLQEHCLFCYASIGVSMSNLVIAWTFTSSLHAPSKSNLKTTRIPKRKIFTMSAGAGTVLATLLFTCTTFFAPLPSFASTTAPGVREKTEVVYEPPAIKSKSSAEALTLANKIRSLDGKMYGAYWCSHCNNQKQLLGKEAMKIVGYVECAKEGLNSQNDLCAEEKLAGYPTWIIDGQKYPGEKSLDELAAIVAKIESSKGLQNAIDRFESSKILK